MKKVQLYHAIKSPKFEITDEEYDEYLSIEDDEERADYLINLMDEKLGCKEDEWPIGSQDKIQAVIDGETVLVYNNVIDEHSYDEDKE